MPTTPLFPIYSKYQAKLVDFHGWNLPVQFSSIIQEHLAVRNQVGLFDVSHMGEILVEGKAATEFLDFVLTNQIATLKPSCIRYSPLCMENGGTIDDLLVYCINKTKYLLVVNASNITKDFDWLIQTSSNFDVSIHNISDETAQLAIQGPNAAKLISQLAGNTLTELKYYQFAPEVKLGNISVLLSRTGYTGEDGFEIYLQPNEAIAAWEILMATGIDYGIQPIGLGARDTLRFEACLPLYGNELSETITPLEAGLERFIKFEKAMFIGKNSLLNQKTTGVPRSLIGLAMIERGIPRAHYQIFGEGTPIGQVTSGSFCPYLNKNMAMALIERSQIRRQEFQVEIRGNLTKAKVVAMPFYSRPKGGALEPSLSSAY